MALPEPGGWGKLWHGTAAAVSERDVALVKEGLEAWRRGDFPAIEALLDPAVTWRASEPGEWDCEGRDEVLGTLRERHEQGFAQGRMELVDGGPARVIVMSWPSEVGGEEWPAENATVISLREGKVVSMEDHPTREDALGESESDDVR